MVASRTEGVDTLASLDRSIEWRKRWADNLFSLVAFIGPVVFVSASLDADSFRAYLPAFFFWTVAASALLLALRRNARAAERRRASLAAQLNEGRGDREAMRLVA